MKLQITLHIPINNNHICKSILDSLIPDNTEIPQGISIEMFCDSNTLFIKMLSEETSILTTRNTIDDLLSHINLALRCIYLIDK